MYLDKICIVSNVVGNEDVIVNGENSFICDSISDCVTCDSISDCVTIVKKVINHDIDEKKLKENAVENILNNYNTKVMIKSYIKIYEEGEI